MSTASTLPTGWGSILDQMHQRLDQAIALADTRMANMPHFEAASMSDERRLEVAKWHERLQRLSTYLESAEQIVQSVDEVLHKEEAALRAQIASSNTLQQKLAEHTARAIG